MNLFIKYVQEEEKKAISLKLLSPLFSQVSEGFHQCLYRQHQLHLLCPLRQSHHPHHLTPHRKTCGGRDGNHGLHKKQVCCRMQAGDQDKVQMASSAARYTLGDTGLQHNKDGLKKKGKINIFKWLREEKIL